MSRTYVVLSDRASWKVLRLSEPLVMSRGCVAEDGTLATSTKDFDVVVICEVAAGDTLPFPRTVIHAGVLVDGPEYWAVSGEYSRIVDGVADAGAAMSMQGYEAAEATA